MGVASTAAAFAGAQAAQLQASLSTAIAKQNHQAEAGLVALIAHGVEAGHQAASGSATAPGTGDVVDISA